MRLFEKNGQKIFDEIFKDMLLSDFFALNDIPEGVDINNMKKLTEMLMPIRNLNLPSTTTILEALTIIEIISNPEEYKKDYPELFIDTVKKKTYDQISSEQEKSNSVDDFIKYIDNDNDDIKKAILEISEEDDNMDQDTLERDVEELREILQRDIETNKIFKSKLTKNSKITN
jgi:hypothetical protein